jgi:hypothetical protein
MYILGQALFSAELARSVARPARLRTAVAIVNDDRAMHELADSYGIEILMAA